MARRAERTLLANLDPEAIRIPVEREAARRMRLDPIVQSILRSAPPLDIAKARREVAAATLPLSEAMAPEVHALMREAKEVLGVHNAVEIFQGPGADAARINAATIYAATDPVIVIVEGRLLTGLETDGILVVLGHELGHFLAHGPRWPQTDMAWVANEVLLHVEMEGVRRLATGLRMAMELTADRFGLLVAQDLDVMLKVLMSSVSGLDAGSMRWSPRTYLEQCKELMERTLESGEGAVGHGSPEHNLRAYAAWLWSETETYAELTGQGPASRSLEEVDATLGKLLRPRVEPAAGRAPGGAGAPPRRRVIRTGPSPDVLDDVARDTGTVLENVGGAIGRAGEKVKPGLSRLKDAASRGIARALDRRRGSPRPSDGPSPLEELDEDDAPDPLADDEQELLDRFAALEKKERSASRPRRPPDPLAEDEQDLLDRFAALERQARGPATPGRRDPSPSSSSERDLLERLTELEKKIR